ncbi:hypothetical protein [Magnetospirillum sp. UT-4]|uniref:hypothetical protein n=1 Tax=Magnetospirillum sp. UT-4 TaxID=2681467 RepID=UPI00137D65D8|nr:hypothetical protein [Magnetospirillum sp. UT-4]CAA7612119.1 hypothetical protein MTBUT4_110048 [Magnetospirillum sp. UT-4]
MDAFKIVVWKDGGEVVAHIPDLFLCARADTWEGAIRKVEEQREALFREYDAAGLAKPAPARARKRPEAEAAAGTGVGRALGLFAAKVAIVGLMAAASLGALAAAIHGSAESLLAGIRPPGVAEMVHRAAERLRSAPPERKAALREDLRVITAELQGLAGDPCGVPTRR